MTAGHASASTQMCMVGVRPRFFLVLDLRGSDPDFFSGNEDFELLQVALGDAPLKVEHLDADNLLPGVEVQHDARLQRLRLDDLRVVQAKVKRIGLRVVADSHVPQAAFLTTSRTFMPARLAMFTSASRLNWPIFPLSREFKRGCVKP